MARLSQVPLIGENTTICNHSVTTTHLMGDSASSVEFFVGIGIVCFLYSMVALLVYLGYMHVYKDSDFGPIFVSRNAKKTGKHQFFKVSYKSLWIVWDEKQTSRCFCFFLQDFVITAILVFLWLVCSSAWAKGLQNVKDATDTEGISVTLALCKGSNITCEVTEFASMRTLNVSVVRRNTDQNHRAEHIG